MALLHCPTSSWPHFTLPSLRFESCPCMRIQPVATWLCSSQPGNGHLAFALLSQLHTDITFSVFPLDTVDALNLVLCASRILPDSSTCFSLFSVAFAMTLVPCHDVFFPILFVLCELALAYAPSCRSFALDKAPVPGKKKA